MAQHRNGLLDFEDHMKEVIEPIVTSIGHYRGNRECSRQEKDEKFFPGNIKKDLACRFFSHFDSTTLA